MRTVHSRFNLYLVLALCLCGAVACSSTRKKEAEKLSTLRVHLETNKDTLGRNPTVAVYRENPVLITIDREPFLDERNVEKAELVDTLGGFAISIQLDHRGRWMLESYTTTNKGRRMVIMSQFGIAPEQTRWLAAPQIRQNITDGTLVFTPDATREEAERIVNGLNYAAKEHQGKFTF